MYAQGADHPLRQACRDLLQSGPSLATTVEVLQELVHVYGRRLGHETAARRVRPLLSAIEIISTDRDDLRRAIDLYDAHPGLGGFDALLAAQCLKHNAAALVSADKAFGAVSGLPWVTPASAELYQLIR
jgi:predicted nucleic acid-binding protein